MSLYDRNFDNTYVRLPQNFYAHTNPLPVKKPELIIFNHQLASGLGFKTENFNAFDAAEIFSGNRVPEGAEPIAMAYAGHQFGGFSPQLGDGRAHLLGEFCDIDGRRWDIHLKGSGPTPFSRRGDGRSPLGPAIREYLISEAMHALKIPTTRSLAVVATGETVLRDKALPGGVLTRIAASHIRVGTFQYFSAQRDSHSVRLLADYVIDRLYPEARAAENPYYALLENVIAKQARLIASWMQLGFIHGVMNTDNMAISGETIDYGPCAFLNSYDPQTVFSSIDLQGRYAYGNQPYIAQWNLARFAETLLPLINPDISKAVDKAGEAVQLFSALFEKSWLKAMGRKIGIVEAENDDKKLIQDFLDLMQARNLDFTQTFAGLSKVTVDNESQVSTAETFANWLPQWRCRINRQNRGNDQVQEVMKAANPVYIPRNHLIEEAIACAVEERDLSKMQALLAVLSSPFEENEEYRRYALPPERPDCEYRTFCGT